MTNSNQSNTYKTGVEKMSLVIFKLVDKYILEWLSDEGNTQFVQKYNQPFIKFQMHIETLFFFMFYIDLFVFSKIGAEKRSVFMNELIKKVKTDMNNRYKDMLNETKITTEEIFSSYDYTIQTYARAYIDYDKKREGINDLWIYGKTIAKMLTGNDSDYTLIMKSYVRLVAFIKYMFWDDITLAFEGVSLNKR